MNSTDVERIGLSQYCIMVFKFIALPAAD